MIGMFIIYLDLLVFSLRNPTSCASVSAHCFLFFLQSEENWDLSDSLADLYLEHDIISKKSWSSLATFKPPSNLDDIDREKWLAADTSHGYETIMLLG